MTRRLLLALLTLLIAGGLYGCGGASSTAPRPGHHRDASEPARWMTQRTALELGGPMFAISCPVVARCWAIGSDGHVQALVGGTWAPAETLQRSSPGHGSIGISCASSRQCVAIPSGGSAVVGWNGQEWSPPSSIDGAGGLEAIGCAPDGSCMTVDGQGFSFRLLGGTWSSASGDWGSVAAISCASSSSCISVSDGISSWDGASWTQPDSDGVTAPFTGVSCPTTGFCMAVDRTGTFLVGAGTTWSAPTSVPRLSTDAFPTAVSCPTARVCVIAESTGALLLDDAGQWSVVDAVGHGAIESLSCPSPSFCAAIDTAGRAEVITTRGRGAR